MTCFSLRKHFLRIPSLYPASALKKKKIGGKLGPAAEKIEVPVETDANKLVNYVCGSNINKTGEDTKVNTLSLLHN